ncbi:MAG: prolyl oligopeptidase family serine peptidase [Planctomycetota bacterium]|jgi:dipeptidyl aminopeptidase/acylaminoacyl peptidase|nr:prolyl oligopeptidase family serine peptidase [Planctomycetota bacterium]MDP7251620.1 prolyl oligopeptidase family serine peptidase [Planctomycetota bacterium]
MKHSIARSTLLFAALLTAVHGGERKTITFKSSLDESEQKAEIYVPSAHDGKKELPLLVYCHPMGMSMASARSIGHHEAAERLGWLVVCPELHGLNTEGKTSFGAVPAQHDVIDAIRFMQKNYKVDDTRIYSDGRSMGGLLSLLLAAKHPHIFAAAVAGSPPTDLSISNGKPFPEVLVKEFGGTRENNLFEYLRREPVRYARNLKYTPVIIWHGSLDRLVPPQHSVRMFSLLRKYNPFQRPVFWLEGTGHNPVGYGADWIFEKLRWHQNREERFSTSLDFILDESGQFSWASIEQLNSGFSSVQSGIGEKTLAVSCTNVKHLKLDMKPFNESKPTEIVLNADAELTVEVVGLEGEPVTETIKKSGRIKLP